MKFRANIPKTTTKIIFFSVLIGFLTSFPIQQASAGVADCITLGIPSVTSSSNSIEVSVSMQVNCTNSQLGSGGGPIYSISEETNATANCSGPYSLTINSRASINCSIKTSGIFASSRTGSTRSTLKIWFARDFSTKYISFSHSAIPSRGITGGASGGSTGGSSSGTSTIACKSAPDKPLLSIEWSSKGVTFSARKASIGETAIVLAHKFAYYDLATKKWENWSELKASDANVPLEVNYSPIEGKSRIAFAVYAINSCGSSSWTRENLETNGIVLDIAKIDVLKLRTDAPSVIGISQKEKSIYDFVESENALDIGITTNTKDKCVANGMNITFIQAGECSLTLKSLTADNIKGSEPLNLKLTIQKNKNFSKLLNAKTLQVKDKVVLSFQTGDNQTPIVESLTPEVCGLSSGKLEPLRVGSCQLKVTNRETAEFESSTSVFEINIEKSEQEIEKLDFEMLQLSSRRLTTLKISSSSELQVQINSSTPKVCGGKNGVIEFYRSGTCAVRLSQAGNNDFLPAEDVTIAIEVLGQAKSILCVRGDKETWVTGKEPKCPKGFKRN